MKRRTPYDRWLSEAVLYGGEAVTRAEMIRRLQAAAETWSDDPTERQLLVGRYLQGHEQQGA